MTGVPPDLFRNASRVLYVCRRYDPEQHYRVMVMKCADCEAQISVTPTVLRDRRRQARAAGVEMDVVCDDCCVSAAEKVGAVIASMPTSDEINQANQ